MSDAYAVGRGSTAIGFGPGLLLLIATGFADAYVFIEHGRVFAEAMTGNLVLIAVGAFDPAVTPFWRPLLTYAAFLLGVAGAWAGLRPINERKPGCIAQVTTLAAGIVVFVVVGLLPVAFPQIVISMAIALVAGSQLALFRDVGGQSITSTVMTSNSFRVVTALLDAFKPRAAADWSAARILGLALGSFVSGAFVGAAASHAMGNAAAFVDAGLFAIVLTWSQVDERCERRGAVASQPSRPPSSGDITT